MNWIKSIIRWFEVNTCKHTWVAKYYSKGCYDEEKWYICTKCGCER